MCGKRFRGWGAAAVCAGVLIILAIIMPTKFWVVMLGSVMVFIGIMLICKGGRAC